LVHRVRQTSAARHLHHVGLGHPAICATTNRRPLKLLYRSWTSIHAAALCRARNAADRTRPQLRQRQRRFVWSTFRLSGVSKWPLPQILGMVMRSGTCSREKHTTLVLVASKHAPATNFSGLHRRAPDCHVGPPSSQPTLRCPSGRPWPTALTSVAGSWDREPSAAGERLPQRFGK
jgi:hypothetical protein